MKIYSIYKSTNKINNKVYIGFDSSWPSRIQQHKHNSKNKSQKFYCAIRKYGWDNFTWELLYQSSDKDHTLNFMENYFILEYNSYENGYNSTLGGDAPTLGITASPETCEKMSISLKNHWSTPQGKKTKSSVSKKNWDRIEYRSLYEKTYTIISPAGLEYTVTNLRKFCDENGIRHTNMYKVTSGKRKSCSGWKLKK